MFDLPGDLARDPRWGRDLPDAPREDVTGTPLNDTHRMTPEYPSTEEVAPEDERLTVISAGMPVWDDDGNKVGEIHEFAVETTTGRPARIIIKRGGILSHSQVDLPLDWVERFGPKGVFLRASKEQVEGLVKNNP